MPPRNQLAASTSTDTRLTSKTTTMKQDMNNTLERMLNHEELTREETKAILIGITRSEYPPEQITALLTGLQMRGVTVDELLGFRDGILETGVPVPLDCERYVDVVGTGGDRKNTFNISTTACFVIAGAGYKVAKHGNYSATSTSGASNVMARHGIKFTDDIGKLNRSLSECGIVYLHAQLFARAMKFVGPIRKSLSFPTCFNLLGPIVNPANNASCSEWPHSTRCAYIIMYTARLASTTPSSTAPTGTMRYPLRLISRWPPTAMSACSRPKTSASTTPGPKNSWPGPPRKRPPRYSTACSTTPRCQHRKRLLWPTQPSAYRCWSAEARASTNA